MEKSNQKKKNDEFQLDDWQGRANKEQAHYAVMGRGIYIYIYIYIYTT